MAATDLSEFVRDALMRGASRGDIRSALTSAGWPAAKIDDALANFADQEFPVPVPRPRAYLSAREAFYYLVLFLLLGVNAINLGALWFALIEASLPDPTRLRSLASAASGLRWSFSALLVAFPLFLYLTWRVGQARASNPAMQDSRLRKWLTYLALVVAASVIVGDLIALIFQFMSGELSWRFLLKALAVGAIAGAIFAYYGQDAERNDAAGRRLLNLAFGGGATIAVAATLIASFSLIGGPARERAYRLDDLRIEHLTQLAGEIDCFYWRNNRLPEDLAEVETDLRAYSAGARVDRRCVWRELADPVSGLTYEFRPIGGAAFELCADFAQARRPEAPRIAGVVARGRRFDPDHGPGRQCFALQADADSFED